MLVSRKKGGVGGGGGNGIMFCHQAGGPISGWACKLARAYNRDFMVH